MSFHNSCISLCHNAPFSKGYICEMKAALSIMKDIRQCIGSLWECTQLQTSHLTHQAFLLVCGEDYLYHSPQALKMNHFPNLFEPSRREPGEDWVLEHQVVGPMEVVLWLLYHPHKKANCNVHPYFILVGILPNFKYGSTFLIEIYM